ncbi:MAG TPA: hypothetical protein VF120_11085 [Ktedonobacterales bacterium]
MQVHQSVPAVRRHCRAATAVILQYEVSTVPQRCLNGSSGGMVCSGPTDAYQTLVLIFAAIAVVGILVGLSITLIRSRSHRPASVTT